MTRMQRIRHKIIERAYYLSSHAEDEMLDDELERDDVEHAIRKGHIQRKLSEDPRGIRYRIEGQPRTAVSSMGFVGLRGMGISLSSRYMR